MLTERVKGYYLGQGYNCAEAMLRGIRDEYALPIGDDSLKLVSGFGGGMYCGRLCGAIAGAVAGLGAMLVEEKGRDTPGFGQRCEALVKSMMSDLGSDLCDDLRPRFHSEENRCFGVVEQAARTFEAYAREAGLQP